MQGGGGSVDWVGEGAESRGYKGVAFLVGLGRPGKSFLGAILMASYPNELRGDLKGRDGVQNLEFDIDLRVEGLSGG